MIWRLPVSSNLEETEAERLRLQSNLDAERSPKERNKLGQFATPKPLADDIARYCLSLHGDSGVRFLEPSCGSGAFFSALARSLGNRHISDAVGVELDERFAKAAEELWAEHGLRVIHGDFTAPDTLPSYGATLLLANPPYVRHHHLSADDKTRLVTTVSEELGIRPSGLSGLYLHFLLLSHRLLAPGAISAWLIPAEFMDVNYGKTLKEYLSQKVTLKRIHRFDPSDVQFDDALVTSAVVVFENKAPEREGVVEFTHGGTVEQPRETFIRVLSSIDPAAKWGTYFRNVSVGETAGPTLKDFFRIRRGLATGSNAFFILPKSRVEEMGIRRENVTPILPSPRMLKGTVVARMADGYPDIDNPLSLINCQLPEEELAVSDPKLAAYLAAADKKVTSGYLVSKRSPWYRQENRPPAPFLCTYMGRGADESHPFRFILNKSDATATNLYLMLYPTPTLQAYIDTQEEGLEHIHKALQSLTAADLRDGGRVYGGGLHKIEPKELGNLRADAIMDLLPDLPIADRLW